jgi:hypothetical protein
VSFRITGPGFYRTRDGRRAEVDKEVVDATFRYGGSIGSFTTNWTVDGRWTLGEMLSCMDLIAPWEEPVEQKKEPFGVADYVALEDALDRAQESRTANEPSTPYHRTEQFRAETARMLFVEFCMLENNTTISQDADASIHATDILIAALDKPQPTTP